MPKEYRKTTGQEYLEALVVYSHLAADPQLNLERVHANEVPRVEEGLVLIRGGHEPIVSVLQSYVTTEPRWIYSKRHVQTDQEASTLTGVGNGGPVGVLRRRVVPERVASSLQKRK